MVFMSVQTLCAKHEVSVLLTYSALNPSAQQFDTTEADWYNLVPLYSIFLLQVAKFHCSLMGHFCKILGGMGWSWGT